MRRLFLSLVFFSIFILGFDYFNISDPLLSLAEPGITAVKKNIYQGVYRLRFLPNILFNYENIVSQSTEKQLLVSENRQLKLTVSTLEKENESLRRQLEAPLPASYKFIPTDVISVSRHMEINSGENQGIKTGQAVVDGQTLIGMISKVTGVRAQVQLLSDNELSVPVITQRGSRGNITGQLGEFVLLKDVLQKDPLFIDDNILTTGENGFPKDLLIGTVVRIDSDDVEVYKRAQVKLFTNPALLKKVFVVQ